MSVFQLKDLGKVLMNNEYVAGKQRQRVIIISTWEAGRSRYVERQLVLVDMVESLSIK